ncbi:MAG: hypothetical protein ABJD97_18800 [Betaproteobacteria bacterium]
MFKPLIRSAAKSHKRPQAGFAETQFLHDADDADYSGFAPTEMFEDADDGAPAPVAAGVSPASQAAASTSRSALARAANAPGASTRPPVPDEEPQISASWVTSQWVAAQEAKAHEAAHHARLVIAAQRRGEAESGTSPATVATATAPRTGFGRLRAALERLLPGEFRSLLPLFICVSVTMALISAVLPLLDKP